MISPHVIFNLISGNLSKNDFDNKKIKPESYSWLRHFVDEENEIHGGNIT